EKLILSFSFKTVEEIKTIIQQHRLEPHKRILQKSLAEEITEMVHGKEDVVFAQKASDILFGNAALEDLQSLNEKQLLEVMEGVPQVISEKAILNEDFDLLSFLADNKIYNSKGEARKMIQNGGLSLNKEKITAVDYKITTHHLLNHQYLLL